MGRKVLSFVLILAAGVALDQVTKMLAVSYLSLAAQVPVIEGYFNLVITYNRGAAFGLLNNLSPVVAQAFFLGITSLILIVVGYLWWRVPEGEWAPALGYSLVMAGALGNFIDRLRLGEVIDFLDFYWGRYHWPAFNVADSLVCLGLGVLVWVIFKEERRQNASHPV